MKPIEKIVNIHGHLRVEHDVDAMVEHWHKLNVVKHIMLGLEGNFKTLGYKGNGDILHWMKKYPDFIVGMGFMNLSKNKDPVSKIEYLRGQGFSGLKFIQPAYNYGDECYFGYYEKAQELGMPILFHTGWVAPAVLEGLAEHDIDSERMRPYQLDRITREFPNLKIIGAHLGWPHHNEALTLMQGAKNLYYDITGGGGGKAHMASVRGAFTPFYEKGAEKQELMDKIFDKLVFGTDNPPVEVWLANSESLMEEFNVSPESREYFYWRNAARIFGWDNL